MNDDPKRDPPKTPSRSIRYRVRETLQMAALFARFSLMIAGHLLVWIGLRRKPPAVSDLKFPVLLIRPDDTFPHVRVTADDLRSTPAHSSRQPSEGSLLIDSDFRMYNVKHVRRRQGEISMIFRYLVPTDRPFTYSFKLKRQRKWGLAAARDRLANLEFDAGAAHPDPTRSAIARQTTMQGIIAVLESGLPKPVVLPAPTMNH